MVVSCKVKKFEVLEESISGEQAFGKKNPDAMINGGIYDSDTGENMTFLTSNGQDSGSYFSKTGIGFDGKSMGVFEQGQVDNFIGGSPVIMRQGEKVLDWGNTVSGYLKQKHIRSWMGLTVQGFLKMGVTETAVYLEELQGIVEAEKCVDAIALDGGGSSYLRIGNHTAKYSSRENASWILVWGERMKTNEDLALHCMTAIFEKWAYVYGFWGLHATEDRIEQKRKDYPNEINRYYEYIMKYVKGRRAVDCGGLIKSFLWWKGNCPIYDPASDLSADAMFNVSTEKGEISSLPEIPGVLVRYPGHVGVYTGNGEVIEARGTLYGVVKTRLQDRKWTHWFKHTGIHYLPPETATGGEFTDVLKDRWSYADIINASKSGIMNGYPDGSFRPLKAVSREELAVIVNRLIKFTGGQK